MNIYDSIAQIVTLVNQDGLQLNYLYGSAKEIQQMLVEASKEPAIREHKYPLLILFTPVDIDVDSGLGIDYQTVLNLVIVTDTEKTYHTHERIENVYKPVLWPLYESLMNHIRLSGLFDIDSSGRIPHTETDRFFYSPLPAHDQNVFSAVLDAVEITDLELSVYPDVIPGCEPAPPAPRVQITHNGEGVTYNVEQVFYN